jgi:hypothetical protein
LKKFLPNSRKQREEVRKMAKLKLIDTKDKFLLEIDGTEIPYVTSYQITRTVGDVVLLKLALSVANVEKVEIASDKITEESRRE